MNRVDLSRQALADLDSIWDYIAADNIVATDELIERIGTRCQSYANQPLLGKYAPNWANPSAVFR